MRIKSESSVIRKTIIFIVIQSMLKSSKESYRYYSGLRA